MEFIGRKTMRQNFKGFDLKLPEWYKNNNPNILSWIKDDLKKGRQFHYLFIGEVGTGKTELTDIIYGQFKQHNAVINDRYIKATEIYQDYLGVMQSNYTDKHNAIRKRTGCLQNEFTILDDLGAEKPYTESSSQFIETILIGHYCFIKKYPCCSIITTNLTGDNIAERYGNRVLDRLHEVFTIMIFNNYSFRQEKTEIIKG